MAIAYKSKKKDNRKYGERAVSADPFDDKAETGSSILTMLVGTETIYRHAMEVILRENIPGQKKSLISLHGCFTVDELKNASEDLDVTTGQSVVVLLLDDGREASLTLRNINAIKNINPSSKIIVVSNTNNVEYIHRCLDNGVHAYILSDIEAGLLLDCIVAVARDYMVFPTEFFHREPEIIPSQTGSTSTFNRKASLASPNETEKKILGCLAAGMSNKEISRDLALSDSATKLAVRNILKKIGAKNRVQAAIWAQQNGYRAE